MAAAAKVADAPMSAAAQLKVSIAAKLPRADPADRDATFHCEVIRDCWTRMQGRITHWGNANDWFPMAAQNGRTIARGTLGNVEATKDPTKVIKVSPLFDLVLGTAARRWQHAERELEALQNLQKERDLTVTLHAAGMHLDADGPEIWLVLSREAASLWQRAGRQTPRALHDTTVALASSLQRLHAAGYVHRDLSPANVLLTPGGEVRLADFGAAIAHQNRALPYDNLCTHAYASPEILAKDYGDTCDYPRAEIFTFGACVWDLAFRQFPYVMDRGTDEPILLSHVQTKQTVGLRQKPPAGADKDLLDLLQRCMNDDPAQRPSWDQILRHPYCGGAQSGAAAAAAAPQAAPAKQP